MRWLDCDHNRINAVSRPVARWLGELNGCSITGNPIADRPELVGLDASLVPQALRAMSRKDAEGSDEQGIGGLERCCWAVRSIMIGSLRIAQLLSFRAMTLIHHR